ncbi:MAG: RNA methyltransferase [Vulcanimicrobiota bacterium]
MLGKHSPKLKQLLQLDKASVRRELGLFLVEGPKLLLEAHNGWHQLLEVYFDPARHEFDLGVPGWHLDSQLLDRVSEAHQGVVGLVGLREWPPLATFDRLVVADGLSDPGNLGTLMRSTWAAGMQALVCLGGVDPYNPKVVRASAGAIFHLPVYRLSSTEELSDHHLVGLTPRGGCDLYSMDWPRRWGLVVGNESHGLSTQVKSLCTIPMQAPCESLNAATSASVVLFEYRRTRLAISS